MVDWTPSSARIPRIVLAECALNLAGSGGTCCELAEIGW